MSHATALGLFVLLLGCSPADALVRVVVGPTPIVDGEAKAPRDVTVINEKMAFALAVESAVPYGVPRGAIIDVAAVQNGKIGSDRVVFADFIPNNWSGWPNSYQHIDILKRGPGRVVIRSVRDWGRVTLTTFYTLESNADQVKMRTIMRNDGDTPLPDLLSGFTLWPKGGFLFGVPGLDGAERGSSQNALADRVVAYDEDWSVTLHAPYMNQIGDGSRDMFRLHTLAPGASRTFEAWLQVGSRGDLAPVLRAEVERKHLATGTVVGTVTGGDAIDQPIIVIEKQGKPYAWAVGQRGHFQVTLPVGEYSLYATARNHSESKAVPVSLATGARQTLDFRDLAPPGLVRFFVADAKSGEPVDASIAIIQGQRPLVGYLGRQKFFTELDRKGRADVTVAPGEYRFEVTHGGAFLGPAGEIAVHVDPGSDREARVALVSLFDPAARQWYCADLHHHADQAEAVTPPADLARSQLAAGLSLLFVSDHDSTVNHRKLQAIADRRAVPFIPGVELSPSWGHFNAWPLTLGERIGIDTGTASVGDIFKEARRLGGSVIQVNHPFIPYGYLTSVRNGVALGGFDANFDLLEINSAASEDDMKVLQRLWDFWNEGHRYYLSAGTDTHDVWAGESGRVRAFAHVDAPLSAANFAQSLKDGHAYVSYGPLVFPSIMFGSTVDTKSGSPVVLSVEIESVAGLKRVRLIGQGTEIDSRNVEGAPREARLEFPLAGEMTWYSLIVEDVAGRMAYTDPIWTARAAPTL